MKEDIVRVLRVLEYEGPRSAVETTLSLSVQGEREFGRITVRAATLGMRAEIIGRQDVEEENQDAKPS